MVINVRKIKVSYPVGYVKRKDRYIFRIFDFNIETDTDTYNSMLIRAAAILNIQIEIYRSQKHDLPEPTQLRNMRLNPEVTVLLLEVEI